MDFPNPDSPKRCECIDVGRIYMVKQPTDDHGDKLEAFPNALSVDLVWKIGKPYISHQFFTNDGRHARRVGSWNQGRAGAIRKTVLRKGVTGSSV